MVLPVAGVLFAPNLVGEAVAKAFMAMPYPHGTAKFVLESSQGVLLRQPVLLPLLLGAGVATTVLSRLAGRRWWVGAGLVTLASLAVPRFGLTAWAPWVVLTLLAGAPVTALAAWRRPATWLAWVPGSTLLAPSLVGAAVGSLERRGLHPVLVSVAGMALALAWVELDCLLHYPAVRASMERWPDSLLDPEIRVLAHSEPGVRADWHGVQVVGDHALVVAETTTRLLALPLDGGPPTVFPLAERWGPHSVAPLDSETDPASGRTWILDKERELVELDFVAGAFAERRRVELPVPPGYAYLSRTQDELLLASVQIAGPTPRRLFRLPLPGLQPVQVVELHAEGDRPESTAVTGRHNGPHPQADRQPHPRPVPPQSTSRDRGPRGPVGPGVAPPERLTDAAVLRDGPERDRPGQLPMPREVAWLDSQGLLALAPDFGTHLWRADPETGLAERWVEMPTLDGKMRYSKALDRLVVALPSRLELWVLDPDTGAVDWTVPTQPGVRSLALDEERGLVVSASVLTGQIWVQDLRTGALHKRLGTVMPMVRELSLSPERGEAVLTTWVATYAFPYVDP